MRKPLNTTNKKSTQKKLRELEVDLAAGRIPFVEQDTSQVVRADGTKDMRVEELAVLHLGWVKANRSAGLFAVRLHYVSQFVAFVGESMVSEITRVRLEAFYIWAKEKHGRGPNGGNEALADVKTMLLWGQEQEFYVLPFRRFPKIVRTPSETKRLPEEDLAKLLATADGDFQERACDEVAASP